MNVYFHDNNSLKKEVFKYIICLIPLYLYGFYKNGIILYNSNYISLFSSFKIFYLLFINLLIYYFINKLIKRSNVVDLFFLSLFVIPLFMPFHINYLIYILIIILYCVFNKYINLYIPILVLSLLSSFLNFAEEAQVYSFTSIDLFFGRGVAGLGTSSIFLGFVIFMYFAFRCNYKYFISLGGIITYIVLCLLFDSSLIFNGNAILSIILLLPWSNLSPYLPKKMIFYGIVTSFLGFLLVKFLNAYYGMILSIVIVNLIVVKVFKLKKI